jgi:cytoskeleton protein RodZ
MTGAQQTASRHRAVGATLKQHRDAQKLSIQDVATRMRLDPRVIESLEADDFEALPAALYVRGYLRSYAKVLNLDPSALIAAYDGAAPEEPPEIVPELKHPAQRTSNDRPVKAVTYLLTLTLVLMVVAWWQSSFIVNERREPPPVVEAPPPGLPYAITVVRHPEGPFYRAPLEAPEAEAAGTDSADAGSGETTTVIGGPDRIRFRFSADSWVEVFDVSGAELHTGLARAGETVNVGGKAPFTVLLGYAPGVSIEFNGRPFDHGRYSQSGVARFTLPD